VPSPEGQAVGNLAVGILALLNPGQSEYAAERRFRDDAQTAKIETRLDSIDEALGSVDLDQVATNVVREFNTTTVPASPMEAISTVFPSCSRREMDLPPGLDPAQQQSCRFWLALFLGKPSGDQQSLNSEILEERARILVRALAKTAPDHQILLTYYIASAILRAAASASAIDGTSFAVSEMNRLEPFWTYISENKSIFDSRAISQFEASLRNICGEIAQQHVSRDSMPVCK
jgi:hypothetical protein